MAPKPAAAAVVLLMHAVRVKQPAARVLLLVRAMRCIMRSIMMAAKPASTAVVLLVHAMRVKQAAAAGRCRLMMPEPAAMSVRVFMCMRDLRLMAVMAAAEPAVVPLVRRCMCIMRCVMAAAKPAVMVGPVCLGLPLLVMTTQAQLPAELICYVVIWRSMLWWRVVPVWGASRVPCCIVPCRIVPCCTAMRIMGIDRRMAATMQVEVSG